MRILVIGRSFPERETGMIGVFELEQALALKRVGNDVVYFFCDTRSIFRIQRLDTVDFEYKGIKISGNHLPIGRLPYFLFSVIKERVFISHLREVVAHFEPDVIHIHYPSIVMTDGIWHYIRLLGSKVFATEHFTKVMTKKISRRTKVLESRILRESDGFICVSGRLKDSVEEISGIKGKINVIPNMVDSTFGIGDTSKNDHIVFSYIGAARKGKQVDKLVEAFHILLRSTDKDCTLQLIGDGPELGRVKRLAAKLGINSCVKFYGNVPRDEVAGILKETDFFITASNLETFCVPVIEAWCSGVPVIISDQIPLLNYANEGNAVIYRDSDVRAMAQAMGKAIENRSAYDKYKIADEAKRVFSSETVVNKIIELYGIHVGGQCNENNSVLSSAIPHDSRK